MSTTTKSNNCLRTTKRLASLFGIITIYALLAGVLLAPALIARTDLSPSKNTPLATMSFVLCLGRILMVFRCKESGQGCPLSILSPDRVHGYFLWSQERLRAPETFSLSDVSVVDEDQPPTSKPKPASSARMPSTRNQRRQNEKKAQSFAHLPAPEEVEQTTDPPIESIDGRASPLPDTGQGARATRTQSCQAIDHRSSSSGDGEPPSLHDKNLPFMSSLSSFTPTPDELAFHRALQTGRDILDVSSRNIIRGNERKKGQLSRRAAVEVDDSDDWPQRHLNVVRPERSRSGRSQSVSMQEHTADVFNDKSYSQSTASHRRTIEAVGKRSSILQTSRRSTSELDMRTVMISLPEGSAHTESLYCPPYKPQDEQCRVERHHEKQGTHGSEHLSPSNAASVADGRPHSVRRSEINQRCLDEAIERERMPVVREDPVAFKRWCAELRRKENELRDTRIAADREYAMELQRTEDAKLVRQLGREELESIARRESAHREIADQKAKMAKLEEELRRRREATMSLEAKIQSSMTRSTHRAVLKTGSRDEKIRAAPVIRVAENSSDSNPKTHSFVDQVILQRTWLRDLMKDGYSRFPDQRIDWDENNKPFEGGSVPARGSPVGTGGVQKMPPYATAEVDMAAVSTTKSAVSPPLRSQSLIPAAESSARKVVVDERSPTVDERKTKQEFSARNMYTKPGYAPVPPSSGGSSSFSSDARSDATYQPETNYSGSTDSDSAFDQEPGSESDVTPDSDRTSPPHTRAGAVCRARSMPPDNSGEGSSSSDGSDADDGRNRGSGLSPRRRPGESARSVCHLRRRNTRRNHHSHGARDNRMHLVEPGDSVSAGIPARNAKKWRRKKQRKAEVDIQKQRATELRMSQLEDKLRQQCEATMLLEVKVKRSHECAAHRVASRGSSRSAKTQPYAGGGREARSLENIREDTAGFRRPGADLIRKDGKLRGNRATEDFKYAVDVGIKDSVVQEDATLATKCDRESQKSLACLDDAQRKNAVPNPVRGSFVATGTCGEKAPLRVNTVAGSLGDSKEQESLVSLHSQNFARPAASPTHKVTPDKPARRRAPAEPSSGDRSLSLTSTALNRSEAVSQPDAKREVRPWRAAGARLADAKQRSTERACQLHVGLRSTMSTCGTENGVIMFETKPMMNVPAAASQEAHRMRETKQEPSDNGLGDLYVVGSKKGDRHSASVCNWKNSFPCPRGGFEKDILNYFLRLQTVSAPSEPKLLKVSSKPSTFIPEGAPARCAFRSMPAYTSPEDVVTQHASDAPLDENETCDSDGSAPSITHLHATGGTDRTNYAVHILFRMIIGNTRRTLLVNQGQPMESGSLETDVVRDSYRLQRSRPRGRDGGESPGILDFSNREKAESLLKECMSTAASSLDEVRRSDKREQLLQVSVARCDKQDDMHSLTTNEYPRVGARYHGSGSARDTTVHECIEHSEDAGEFPRTGVDTLERERKACRVHVSHGDTARHSVGVDVYQRRRNGQPESPDGLLFKNVPLRQPYKPGSVTAHKQPTGNEEVIVVIATDRGALLEHMSAPSAPNKSFTLQMFVAHRPTAFSLILPTSIYPGSPRPFCHKLLDDLSSLAASVAPTLSTGSRMSTPGHQLFGLELRILFTLPSHSTLLSSSEPCSDSAPRESCAWAAHDPHRFSPEPPHPGCRTSRLPPHVRQQYTPCLVLLVPAQVLKTKSQRAYICSPYIRVNYFSENILVWGVFCGSWLLGFVAAYLAFPGSILSASLPGASGGSEPEEAIFNVAFVLFLQTTPAQHALAGTVVTFLYLLSFRDADLLDMIGTAIIKVYPQFERPRRRRQKRQQRRVAHERGGLGRWRDGVLDDSRVAVPTRHNS
ncbi:hypothetical protein GGX14DRAFT_385406 [Mycena pura]|uniref:Transmembrane protein n=1 Tax=Mycena pura TaxID=153505 RepID=A0AAD7E532_9AGAR|nr:hypothetical protein GGX14DRAFT_385406 [Mycena pura]